MCKFLRKLFGYNYLLNKHTGEVHKVSEISRICGVDKMSKKIKNISQNLNLKRY